MKSLYYRPESVSTRSLVSMAIFAIGLVTFIELAPNHTSRVDQESMLSASQIAEHGFRAVRRQREQLGHRMLGVHDPAGTGMLGPSMSLVTTLPGHLDAKQTSVNPNFAAVIVKYLRDAGAQQGDRVAIGCTGSFPALNIATLAAAETLGLQVAMISSAASSQYGANHPEFMWPDMERLLVSEGILKSRSLAISRGGFRDQAAGMTDETRARLDEAIARSEVPLIRVDRDENPIDVRVDHYLRDAKFDDFVAYINVGGGHLSIGGTKGKEELGVGLIEPARICDLTGRVDSVAHRFLKAGVPLINVVDAVKLAEKYGLPIASTKPIEVGSGKVYSSSTYHRGYALLAIALIFGQVYLVMRPPRRWTAFLHSLSRHTPASEPRLMV